MLKLLRTALFASLTALGTFVAVPLPYVILGPSHLPNADPWWSWHALSLGVYTSSAQGLAMAAAGSFLGPAGAFMSQFAYLCLGLFGLPVFADGGGWGYLHTAGFPFLATFPFAAWLTAKLSGSGGGLGRWKGLMVGQLLVLVVGTLTEIGGAGHLMILEAWGAHGWPLAQTLPSLMVAMIPFALLGALGDRIRTTAPQPSVPEREALPAPRAKTTGPIHRQLPGPPDRLSLPEAPRRQKAIEGPPPRIPLSEGPKDS